MRPAALALALAGLAWPACKKHEPAAAAAPSARASFEAGQRALEAGRTQEAITELTRAASGADDAELRANAWLGLGAAYAEAHDPAHAVAAYEQVTVLRPDDADAWRVLAIGLGEAGRRERQAQALARLLALEPDDLQSYLELAGVQASLGHADGAKDAYTRYEARRTALVIALGKSPDAAVRAAAAGRLGGARDVGTARALALTLTDRVASVRAAAATSLGHIGLDVDPALRPALQAVLGREPDAEVRAALATALKP